MFSKPPAQPPQQQWWQDPWAKTDPWGQEQWQSGDGKSSEPWPPFAEAGEEDPDEEEDDAHIDPNAAFEDFSIREDLLQGLYEYGFVRPSKIQSKALPYILWKDGKLGQNMIGQAQSGAGKTATFSLALLSAVDMRGCYPQGLVVCPTRELARQNTTVLRDLGKFTSVKISLVVPGESFADCATSHVLIGTPGKLVEVCKKSHIIDTRYITVLVLDEADILMTEENPMDEQVTRLRSFLNESGLQVLLFSATYPEKVKQFARTMVPEAVVIEVEKTDLTVASVTQQYIVCNDAQDKFSKLCSLYSAMTVGQSVVFCNRRVTAIHVAERMKNKGFPVTLIRGTQKVGTDKMTVALRDKVMDEFRRGTTRVLVATDVLSRGIDVPQVTLVVNFELPLNRGSKRCAGMETYLHRVGRTGRFGLSGHAVNLVTRHEKSMIPDICSYFACKIEEVEADFEKLEEQLRAAR